MISRGISIVFVLLMVCVSLTIAQNNIDSLLLKKYPLIIGNIGFNTDSVEVVIGDIPRGETTILDFEVFNFGKDPVLFTNGKSNKFISTEFDPIQLLPNKSGKLSVHVEADIKLDLGSFDSEISIVSDDKQNPYKFITLLMNIVEGSKSATGNIYDSIPHINFDHYNYDYGHLRRGKIMHHTFVVSNDGGLPLYISEVIPPKGVEVLDMPMSEILPGSSGIIRLRINTRGRVGIQHHTILVKSNDPENPLVILGLHGSVRVYPSHKKPSNQCGAGSNRY